MIFLGLDCGTQSTKALALDWETGAVLAVTQREHRPLAISLDGTMEQEPREWTQAAEACLDELMAMIKGRRGEVRGIGVSGQQHGLVLLDQHDEVVRPAKLWCDTSSARQGVEITAQLGGAAEVIKHVGNTMRPGYTAPKIAWVRQNEPENWSRTAVVLLPHNYLNFWLTGQKNMEYGDASGTALLDIRRREWSASVAKAVAPGLLEKLPRLQSSSEPAGLLQSKWIQRWGLAGEVVVSAGSGDNMMAAIGTGNVRPGVVTASLGTSGTLFAFASSPFIDSRGEIAGFCDATDHWLPLICTTNLTLVTEHVRHLFAWDFPRMDREIAAIPAGAEGLTFLPYLVGERTPDLPDATGILSGLTLQNFRPGHLARAALEGVTFGLAAGLKRLTLADIKPSEIRLTGGGSNSPIWRQICADIFGVKTIQSSNEGAAFGAAIHTGWTAARRSSESESLAAITDRIVTMDESTVCQPDPAVAVAYDSAMQKYASVLSSVRDRSFEPAAPAAVI